MEAEALLKAEQERREQLQKAEDALRDAKAAAAALETTRPPFWAEGQ